MQNKYRLFVFVFALLVAPYGVFAQVVISEIMYDISGTDTDREWVEVFNAGASPVHFTDWKLFEANTNHGITSAQGGENLVAGAHAVIADNPAKFLQDWPSYSGILFDSTFSLGNSGETLAIHMPPPDLVETDSVPYQGAWGAAGNGNSLQRTSVSGPTFVESSPTPGAGSLSSSGGGGSSSTSSDTGATTSTSQSAGAGNSTGDSAIMPPPPKVFADGGSDRTVIVGADTEFKARAYDEKKNVIDFSRFHWNFGDGSTSDASSVSHRFDYPGRYIVILDIPEEKDSVPDQIIVTAERAEFVLSFLPDGGVAIENHTGRTLDLSRWILRSLGRTFVIPERTFILANSPLRMSLRTLGFSSGADVELAYPDGALALSTASAPTSTPALVTPAPVVVSRTQRGAGDNESMSRAFVPQEENTPVEQPEVPASTTGASLSQAAGAGAIPLNSSRMWWMGAIGIAGFAAVSLALARRFGKKEWDIEEDVRGT